MDIEASQGGERGQENMKKTKNRIELCGKGVEPQGWLPHAMQLQPLVFIYRDDGSRLVKSKPKMYPLL